MKRSKADSTRSKKTHIPSDFKRLKGKVGKRAPQKLNQTETSFRTAAIQTRSQSVSKSGESVAEARRREVLISTRGKTIRDLASQLNHVAANSRVSALQGIKDAAGLSLSSSNVNVNINGNGNGGRGRGNGRGRTRATDDDDEKCEHDTEYQLTKTLVVLPAIESNLSILLPSLSKCFIDDSPKVRSLAISLLYRGLVPRIALITASNNNNNNTSSSDSSTSLSMMQPFTALMLAYIKSALHSLDSDVRYDGCVALELLCTQCTSLFQTNTTTNTTTNKNSDRVALEETMPAFVKLLEDVGGGLASLSWNRGIAGIPTTAVDTDKSSSNKTTPDDGRSSHGRDTKWSSRGVGVLRSLIAVVKILSASASTSSPSYDDRSAEEHPHPHTQNGRSLVPSIESPDLTFVPGGTASNALVLPGRKPGGDGYAPELLNGIHDLGRFRVVHAIAHTHDIDNDEDDVGDTSTGTAMVLRHRRRLQPSRPRLTTSGLSTTVQSDLLSKLRDRFVEVIQRGQTHPDPHTGTGLFLSLSNVEELSLVVSSLRLVWGANPPLHTDNITDTDIDTDIDTRKKLRSLGNNVHDLLLESLPVKDNSGNPKNRRWYDLLNASVCCAIGEYGSTLALSEATKEGGSWSSAWVDAIFTYLLPRLDNEEDASDDDTTALTTTAVTTTTGAALRDTTSTRDDDDSNTRVTLLRVIAQLLVRNRLHPDSDDFTDTEHGLGSCPLEDHSKRMRLLQKFGGAFFPRRLHAGPHEDRALVEMVGAAARRSAEGRRAAALLTTLITQHILLRTKAKTTTMTSSNDDGLATRDAEEDVMESGFETEEEEDPMWLETWELLTKMAAVLPSYLISWRGAFPKLSGTVLATLLSIARQSTLTDTPVILDTPDTSDEVVTRISFQSVTDRLCSSLRDSITGLFLLSEKKSLVASIENGRVYKYRVSVFEQLSAVAQKLTLGIVGMLRHPSARLITSLSQICVHRRCRTKPSPNAVLIAQGERTTAGLDGDTVDYAMGVIHSVRRTVSLQSYLTFLISCTGINAARYRPTTATTTTTTSEDTAAEQTEPDHGSATGAIDVSFVVSYDPAIARSCRYLLLCGGTDVVLRMLTPVLSSWIGGGGGDTAEDAKGGGKGSSAASSLAALKLRASLCVLSYFAAVDDNNDDDDVKGKRDDTMDDVLVRTVCASMLSVPLAREIHSDERTNEGFVKILAPLVALLGCRPSLLCNLLKECARQIRSDECDVRSNESFLNSLLVLVRSKQLKAKLRIPHVAQTLKDTSASIERVSKDGPLDMLGGSLYTEVQALLGFSF